MKAEDYEPYDPIRFRERQAARLAAAPERLGLSAATIERIRRCRYDRILEKHEGPEDWDAFLRFSDPAFIEAAGYRLLLPIDDEHHPHITIQRTIPSHDGQSLTLFFQDTTYAEDPRMAGFDSWYFAFCEKFPGEEFYLATVYHEWYFIAPLATQVEGTSIN